MLPGARVAESIEKTFGLTVRFRVMREGVDREGVDGLDERPAYTRCEISSVRAPLLNSWPSKVPVQ